MQKHFKFWRRQRKWAWKRMNGSNVFIGFYVVVVYSFKKKKQRIFDDHNQTKLNIQCSFGTANMVRWPLYGKWVIRSFIIFIYLLPSNHRIWNFIVDLCNASNSHLIKHCNLLLILQSFNVREFSNNGLFCVIR